jgi:feruloyl esterase
MYLDQGSPHLNPGHQSDWLDGSWGLNNDDVIIDFGHRAVHLSVVASKGLTALYYGKEHSKSYFSGCSNGGRQGIKSMASYPEDFDGLM